jgi:hypothetical protein
MGINHVTLPTPAIDRKAGLKFQESLIATGIEYSSFNLEESHIFVTQKHPLPLEIRVVAQISSPQPFGQILVVARQPNRPLSVFAKEVSAILEAFNRTWPSAMRQLLTCDVTLRCLYESTSEHAFKELWEERLRQPPALLGSLQRKVLGGGLRFVMPPQPGDADPAQVELKIESFLRDTSKIFVETQFVWPEPQPPGTPFNPTDRLDAVDQYILNQVAAFLMEGES